VATSFSRVSQASLKQNSSSSTSCQMLRVHLVRCSYGTMCRQSTACLSCVRVFLFVDLIVVLVLVVFYSGAPNRRVVDLNSLLNSFVHADLYIARTLLTHYSLLFTHYSSRLYSLLSLAYLYTQLTLVSVRKLRFFT
jgi:hypothetical protein